MLTDIEVAKLEAACMNFDRVIHSEAFKLLPACVSKISVKSHILVAHVVAWAKQYHTTGAYSESYVSHSKPIL